jgi:hypothetical protein
MSPLKSLYEDPENDTLANSDIQDTLTRFPRVVIWNFKPKCHSAIRIQSQRMEENASQFKEIDPRTLPKSEEIRFPRQESRQLLEAGPRFPFQEP